MVIINKPLIQEKMKKILFYAASMVLLMPLFANCTKDEFKGDESQSPVITASTESSQTKTEMTADLKTKWLANDAIKIFSGTDGATVSKYKTTDGGTTNATFIKESGDDLGATPYYAVYPYSDNTTIGAESSVNYLYFTIPTVQTYKANSFASDESIMVAYGNSTNLSFKNVCGMYEIKLTGSVTVKTITLTANHVISGPAKVAMNYTDGEPVVTMTGGDNTIELNCGEGVALSGEATSFFFLVPAGTHKFTIGIEAMDGSNKKIMYQASPSSGVAVTRSRIKPMATLAFAAQTDYGYPVNGEMKAGTTITVSSTNYIWAPVNCGYQPADGSYKGYPYGKLYQWGRKDGQGYDDGAYKDATTPSVIGVNPADLASADANTFYTTWNNTIAPDGTWGTSDPWKTKTTYDPCPAGWRVPTSAELTALLGGNLSPSLVSYNSQFGAWFNGTNNPGTTGVFLPAAGDRGSYGSAYSRGEDGYYWSSTPNNDYAYYLYFFFGFAEVNFNHRAYGLSVRCVRD
jgi:uncharacterized protein (TIGR02145 family)